jgi:3-hydroxyisobutyrate dehydrogenase-like beta-hydroxyacid dehydrogenase
VKLANNMVLGCAIEAMGEGFALTRKFDVDPPSFNDVLTDGLFAAPAYKVYGASSRSRATIRSASRRCSGSRIRS